MKLEPLSKLVTGADGAHFQVEIFSAILAGKNLVACIIISVKTYPVKGAVTMPVEAIR